MALFPAGVPTRAQNGPGHAEKVLSFTCFHSVVDLRVLTCLQTNRHRTLPRRVHGSRDIQGQRHSGECCLFVPLRVLCRSTRACVTLMVQVQQQDDGLDEEIEGD